MVTITLKEFYLLAKSRLPSDFEARQAFEHITGSRIHDIALSADALVTQDQIDALSALAAKRAQGAPLQYLLGEWEFYGLPFYVGEGVLIPRPDTEVLVDTALLHIKEKKQPEILDLCAGSGCIAIVLSHERRDAQVTALELSEGAYAFLLRNIQRNASAARPVQADLCVYQHPCMLDLVVSNPPYIPAGDISGLQTEVQHEPRIALDGGEDGLLFYREIANRYFPQIAFGGGICLEIGIGQQQDVARILEAAGFSNLATTLDLAGIPRVVSAQKL